jgi:hypothetical protein
MRQTATSTAQDVTSPVDQKRTFVGVFNTTVQV